MPALAPADRREAVTLVHQYVHRRHMSIREARDAMLHVHGIRRSLAQLHADLHGHTCDRCEP